MGKPHRYDKERKTKFSNLAGGLKNYASNSTVHGINYVFDESLSIFERFIWLLVVCGLGCVAMFLVYESYNTWQDIQVITTLKTVAKPVTELTFPAVTICGTGQHLDTVEKVLLHNFYLWNETRGEGGEARDDGDAVAGSEEDLFYLYMEEVFQISEKNISILDILSTMISPAASDTNAVRQNEIACSNKAKQLRRQASGTGFFPKLPKNPLILSNFPKNITVLLISGWW